MFTHPCSTDPGTQVARAVSEIGLKMRAPSLGSTARGAACDDLWPTNDTGRSASSPKLGPALSADVGTENRRSEANGWKYKRRLAVPIGDRASPMIPSISVNDSPATCCNTEKLRIVKHRHYTNSTRAYGDYEGRKAAERNV